MSAASGESDPAAGEQDYVAACHALVERGEVWIAVRHGPSSAALIQEATKQPRNMLPSQGFRMNTWVWYLTLLYLPRAQRQMADNTVIVVIAPSIDGQPLAHIDEKVGRTMLDRAYGQPVKMWDAAARSYFGAQVVVRKGAPEFVRRA